MKGKSGWIRILEATVAVLVVSTTMIAVFSNQERGSEQITVSDYSYSLQKQILADIVLDSDLRLDALSVEEDVPGDAAYDSLRAFVDSKIPDSFGYLLRVCDLGNVSDFCKMDSNTFIATLDKDVFVEEVVISSELGNGSDPIYSPRKVRLFFWEGGFPAGYCVDECSGTGIVLSCSPDLRDVLSRTCGEFDAVKGDPVDDCLEYSEETVDSSCGMGHLCIGAACVPSLYSEWTCEKRTIVETGCVSNFNDECDDHDGGQKTGGCGLFGLYDEYECWDVDSEVSSCELMPSCTGGYDFVSAAPCVPTITVGVLSASYSGLEYNAVEDRWYYDLEISETGGVGVTLEYRQRCFQSTGCEGKVYDPVDKFGTNRINPNDKVSASGRWFWTAYSPDKMTETWYGTDDKGNDRDVSYSIDVS